MIPAQCEADLVYELERARADVRRLTVELMQPGTDVRRAWFEGLGGFSPRFIFGHYEDVDLCLRSLEAGMPAWLHDIPFLHLESVGATHSPVHDGGRLVNRWYLTTKWCDWLVRNELIGPSPAGLANRR